jgi:acyl carrier protein
MDLEPHRTPSSKVIEEALVGFICRNFLVEPEDIRRDLSLVDQGVIDSFGLIEIAAFMEREFAIKVGETDMNRANFGSITKMAAFIGRKVST